MVYRTNCDVWLIHRSPTNPKVKEDWIVELRRDGTTWKSLGPYKDPITLAEAMMLAATELRVVESNLPLGA